MTRPSIESMNERVKAWKEATIPMADTEAGRWSHDMILGSIEVPNLPIQVGYFWGSGFNGYSLSPFTMPTSMNTEVIYGQKMGGVCERVRPTIFREHLVLNYPQDERARVKKTKTAGIYKGPLILMISVINNKKLADPRKFTSDRDGYTLSNFGLDEYQKHVDKLQDIFDEILGTRIVQAGTYVSMINEITIPFPKNLTNTEGEEPQLQVNDRDVHVNDRNKAIWNGILPLVNDLSQQGIKLTPISYAHLFGNEL